MNNHLSPSTGEIDCEQIFIGTFDVVNDCCVAIRSHQAQLNVNGKMFYKLSNFFIGKLM